MNWKTIVKYNLIALVLISHLYALHVGPLNRSILVPDLIQTVGFYVYAFTLYGRAAVGVISGCILQVRISIYCLVTAASLFVIPGLIIGPISDCARILAA